VDFLKLGVPWWGLPVRAAVIYAVLFLGMRLFGNRQIGQFTLFDLVLVLLASNAMQPAITGPDTSLTGGLIIILVLLLINRGVALLRIQSPFFDRLIEPQATVVAREGAWIMERVRQEGLSLEDCEMAIREHGIDRVADVRLAVLEEDGTISVVPKDAPVMRSRRRVRFHRQR